MSETNGHGHTSTALVRQPAGFEPANLSEAMQLATQLSASALIPTPLRGRPGDVMVILIAGHEMGLSPMQALRGIHVIEGKPVVSADLMVAQAVRRRDVCRYFRLVRSTDAVAEYETHREGNDEPIRMSFTIEQAKAADLAGKKNWKTYPAAMLRARCSSALARAVYPDLLFGVYETDEGEEIARHAPRQSPTPQRVDSIIDAVVEADLPPAERCAEALQRATTLDELQAIVPRMQALAENERAELRPLFAARKRELSPRKGTSGLKEVLRAKAEPVDAPPPPADPPPPEDDGAWMRENERVAGEEG